MKQRVFKQGFIPLQAASLRLYIMKLPSQRDQKQPYLIIPTNKPGKVVLDGKTTPIATTCEAYN